MKRNPEEILALLPRTKETGTFGDHFAVSGAAVMQLANGKDPYEVLDNVLMYLLSTEDDIKRDIEERAAEVRNDVLLTLNSYFPGEDAEA